MAALSIRGENFFLDGRLVNAGRVLDGIPLDGLLVNSRMINGIFDDLNPETRQQWAYPDTGTWDPDRNTAEFIAAMPQWRRDGLDAFTLGVQLIALAQAFERDGRRLLVSSSFIHAALGPDATPPAPWITPEVIAVADFALFHGNGSAYPARLAEMADKVRNVPGYRPMPLVINEDDHFDFDQDENHMKIALRNHVSWGYFDPGSSTVFPDPAPTLGDYRNGFQAVPVNWGPSSPLKRAFFDAIRPEGDRT